jgi:26S proteasome non-ATPase regulatory subunit 10
MYSWRLQNLTLTGDTALALLKAGAETDKKDVDGFLAIDLAPDGKVSCSSSSYHIMCSTNRFRSASLYWRASSGRV